MHGRRESRLCLCIERGGEEVGLREGGWGCGWGNWEEKGVWFLYQYGSR